MMTSKKGATLMAIVATLLGVVLISGCASAPGEPFKPLPNKEWKEGAFSRIRTVSPRRNSQMAEVWVQAQVGEVSLERGFNCAYIEKKDGDAEERRLQTIVYYPDVNNRVALRVWGIHLMKGEQELDFLRTFT